MQNDIGWQTRKTNTLGTSSLHFNFEVKTIHDVSITDSHLPTRAYSQWSRYVWFRTQKESEIRTPHKRKPPYTCTGGVARTEELEDTSRLVDERKKTSSPVTDGTSLADWALQGVTLLSDPEENEIAGEYQTGVFRTRFKTSITYAGLRS